MSRITRVSKRNGELKIFAYTTITFYGRPFQTVPLTSTFVTPQYLIPRPQEDMSSWFRLFRVRSPLLAESLLFSLPLGTEMVHFPRFASTTLFYSDGDT